MLLEVTAMFLLIWLLILKWNERHLRKLSEQLKSTLRTLPLLGHSYLVCGNDEATMKGLQLAGQDAIKCGGSIALWLLNKLYIMIADPKSAEYVLKNCHEKDDLVKFYHVIIGDGSVFTSVPIWRPRRKLLAPTFNMKNLNSFVDVFAAQSCIMMKKLKTVAGKGPTSMWQVLSTYTLDAVGGTTLGVHVKAQENPNHPVLLAALEVSQIVAARVCKPWLYSDFIFKKLSLHRTLLKHKAVLYEFVDKIIKQKRKASENIRHHSYKETQRNGLKSLVELMLESKLDGSDVAIREECLVILGAGNDTTAISMGYALVMLARHPEVQEKVYMELNDVFGDFDRPVSADDLQHFKYLDAVMKETLRLYPPIPIISRKIEHGFRLPSGVTLLPGCGVLINIWAINRNPHYWGNDAEQFRPERFFDSVPEHPAAFMAFSCGPRNCLGHQYAMMLMKTVLATLLKQYRIVPASLDELNKPLRVKFNIMMRHVDNYCVGIEYRK